MALVLYDIFWSHFCEKARFCLDFKELPHSIVRVNPFTRREVIDLGARGDVPVLVDGGRVVAGSAAIAAHLFEWKRRLARAHRRRQRTPWLSGGPPPGYPRLPAEEA